jgi:hypothetical protein
MGNHDVHKLKFFKQIAKIMFLADEDEADTDYYLEERKRIFQPPYVSYASI